MPRGQVLPSTDQGKAAGKRRWLTGTRLLTASRSQRPGLLLLPLPVRARGLRRNDRQRSSPREEKGRGLSAPGTPALLGGAGLGLGQRCPRAPLKGNVRFLWSAPGRRRAPRWLLLPHPHTEGMNHLRQPLW